MFYSIHKILFAFYPELKEYKIRFDNIKEGGIFYNRDKLIVVNKNRLKNQLNTNGTIIHELQHAIQNIENFETGMSTKSSKLAYYKSLGENEAKDSKTRYINDKKESLSNARKTIGNIQTIDTTRLQRQSNTGNNIAIENSRTYRTNDDMVTEKSTSNSKGNDKTSIENKSLEDRVSGDKLLDTQDFIVENSNNKSSLLNIFLFHIIDIYTLS